MSRKGSAYSDWYKGPRLIHIHHRKPCEHSWDRWEDFADGNGGTMVCGKCGLTAIAHTLSLDDAFTTEEQS